jgi:hypothetical protein
LIEHAVDTHGPIERAFEAVRVSPRSEMTAWIGVPNQDDLLYKKESDYWSNWKGSIYRSAGQA